MPLSGAEVIEAIKSKVGEMLERDCFLSPNCAYEGISGSIQISIKGRDMGRIAEVDTKVPVQVGAAVADDEDMFLRETSHMIEEQPPNQVRAETGQKIPVLVRDGEDRSRIEHVSYEKGLKKAIDKPPVAPPPADGEI
jgi:hypothetical protein